MSENNKEENQSESENILGKSLGLKVVAVCKFCRNHDTSPMIEFNFGDGSVYYMCSSCRKTNKMEVQKIPLAPYPKTKRIS
jgi:hypothetical protein